MVAALHVSRLTERDDRRDPAGRAGVIDEPEVVAAVERSRLGREATRVERVEERDDGKRLVLAGGLDFPGERQPRAGADSGMDAIPIEPATFPRRDSRAVAPTR